VPKSNIKFVSIQKKSVNVHVCFVFFIVCLYICICECLLQNNNHKTKHQNDTTFKQHSCVRGPLRECRSIRSGASGLPYDCTPLVCISAAIGLLAVWLHNKPKTKNQKSWYDKRRNDEFCELRRMGEHLAEGAAKDTGYVHATVFPARVASSKHVSPLATGRSLGPFSTVGEGCKTQVV